jgi:Flp pilus assembly protein TadD
MFRRKSVRHFDLCAGCRAAAVLAAVLAIAPGCRLTGEGPVSRSLVTCRQLSQRGVSALERHDSKTAESLLGQAVTACPVDAEARRHYAEALWQNGERAKAVAQLDEALKLAGDDETLRVRVGEMRLTLGDIEAARRHASLAIELNPRSGAAWALRGRVMQQSGQPREALADYHRALGLLPDDRSVLLNLAETYRTLGEPHRALANLQRLSDTYASGEEPPQVLYLEGLALVALGRSADAVVSFTAARDRGPPTPDVLFQLASAQSQAGRDNDARQSVLQALALNPTHPASRELLARLDMAAASGALAERR